MTQPRRLSVIVPTRDRPAFLRQALASIRALEGADLSFEILVGDNGSSAETHLVTAEFGATYIKVAEQGASAARNAGLRAATGEFICFLDDDDVWLPGHIRPQLALLDARPEVEAVIGCVISTDKDLAPRGEAEPATSPGERDELLRKMLAGWFPQIGTTVARASVRDAIGEFDLALLGGQDLDWLLRIARRRSLVFQMTTCLLFRGRSPGSYDALQYRRIRFDRRVFLRHAVPEWRVWKSPQAMSRAYSGTMMHFYTYFAEAAEARSRRGDRLGALRAIGIAASVFPLRSAFHLLKRTPLRSGALGIFGLQGAARGLSEQ
ncbi:MAG: glycosyltransferase family A protein [Alphaproteobacteria bacterium]